MKAGKGFLVTVAAVFGLATCGHLIPDEGTPATAPVPLLSTAASASSTGTADAAVASPTGDGVDESPTVTGDTASVLATIPVKGRAPKVGYDRDLFPHWLDGPSGCPADVDAVKAAASVELAGTCKIAAAALTDPYTGDALSWSGSRAGVVDVDHVVALGDAWQKGAQAWDAGKRARFANDPLNLAAVSASVNRAKGDGDAATWLPPLKAYRCEYVARQVQVKAKYGLWVTTAERDAIGRVLEACPGQPLPGPQQPAPTPTATPALETSTPADPAPAPKDTADDPPALTTCKAVKAAGLGPYRRGVDPEYGDYQDRDGDGVVCE